jgi:hypothetical protein
MIKYSRDELAILRKSVNLMGNYRAGRPFKEKK